MTAADAVLGWVLALTIAAVTVPVGVSGAVFLLPVQLGVLHAPSPTVTPTNLLYNVIATPGALLRYRSQGRLSGPLVRLMAWGTLPGVMIGAVLRVTVVSGPQVFRLLLAALMLPLGIWLLVGRSPGGAPREPGPPRPRSTASTTRVVSLALGVGVIGGVYGIGGGSILGPVLVATGLDVATVAPAALTATFLTSLVGVGTYAVLALTGAPGAAPDWRTGLLLGTAGLVGGYLGTRLQPRISALFLRRLLGFLAIVLALGYGVAAVAARAAS